jgi:tetratricopeptide (TPR) repeat protein
VVVPVSALLRVRRYDLGSAPYQTLLRDYLCGRLSLDLAKAEDVALADAIIRAADSRFAYVSFLADRREVGQVLAENIAALAMGSGLYQLWLANLEREYGRKQAEAIRQVLALLAAMEEAHAWVFGEGRKIDPATGGALTPLPEQFAGLEIGLLARLLDLDRPQAEAHDRIDPGLLLTLQMLQGVLWVSRAGEGTTRFRLALKEFLPAAKDDPVVGPMLKLMQARVAARALDAADQLIAGDDQTGDAWALLEPLTPLLEALVHLSGSEPIAQRWNPADLVSLLAQRDDNLRDQGHALGRVPGLTLIAALGLTPSRYPPEALPMNQRNDLATVLQNRGAAKAGGGDVAGAIADYDAAIALMQAIRAALGETWPVPLQNDLATVLQNRGAAKVDGGDLAGAIADYDAAIALRQAIRAALGEAWPVPLQNDLATVLQNRGAAKGDGGDLAGAIADFDAAIALRQAIRAALGEAWPAPLQSDLAGSLQSLGLAKAAGGDLAGAIADYDAAIALMQAIRAALGEAWPVPLQNDLAMSLVNRGAAKTEHGDLAGAIADADAAIGLMEDVRRRVGQAAWSSNPSWANSLHAVRANRAMARWRGFLAWIRSWSSAK